jgi:hypothetical protein
MGVDGIGSGSSPIVGSGTSAAEPSGPTTMLVN